MPMPKSRNPRTARRGFANMAHDRQVEIARLGGASVPHEKRSFFVDRSLAAAAGRKGGKARHANPAAVPVSPSKPR